MAKFRETDGTGGCPPTVTPPAGYEIPFAFDDNGNLWITGCFSTFKFFGFARHDVSSPAIMGSVSVPLATGDDIVAGSGITAGTYSALNITNSSACDLGLLFGYDLNADLDVKGDSFAKLILSGRFNGTHIDSISCSSVRTGSSSSCRIMSGNAANPHDPGIEGGGSPTLTLASGATCTVSARLFLQYGEGSPDGEDQIVSSGSAVRVYGYCL